jgi:hypothetical protein
MGNDATVLPVIYFIFSTPYATSHANEVTSPGYFTCFFFQDDGLPSPQFLASEEMCEGTVSRDG